MLLGKNAGFTLIELIMVMIIVGILAVAVMPKFTDQSVFQSRGFHDETLALLRYAQKSAIAQRRTVCVTLSATGISMVMATTAGTSNCATSTPLTLPAAPRNGTGLSTSPTTANFNFLGSGATNLSGNLIISNTGSSTTITVEATTGYVHE
jgi:MSHA pilin protein MshC